MTTYNVYFFGRMIGYVRASNPADAKRKGIRLIGSTRPSQPWDSGSVRVILAS